MQAAPIEYNLTAVDAAVNAVREALASGLTWRQPGRMIEAWPPCNSSLISPHLKSHLTTAMQAALIEYNLTAVDAAINAVREALASGLDWRELGQMIKAERRAGNPVAGLIDSLALDKNKITVVLENFLDEEDADDDAMTRPATKVCSGTDQMPHLYQPLDCHMTYSMHTA